MPAGAIDLFQAMAESQENGWCTESRVPRGRKIRNWCNDIMIGNLKRGEIGTGIDQSKSVMREAYIDENLDEEFDIRITYDSSERPTNVIPLSKLGRKMDSTGRSIIYR